MDRSGNLQPKAAILLTATSSTRLGAIIAMQSFTQIFNVLLAYAQFYNLHI